MHLTPPAAKSYRKIPLEKLRLHIQLIIFDNILILFVYIINIGMLSYPGPVLFNHIISSSVTGVILNLLFVAEVIYRQ